MKLSLLNALFVERIYPSLLTLVIFRCLVWGSTSDGYMAYSEWFAAMLFYAWAWYSCWGIHDIHVKGDAICARRAFGSEQVFPMADVVGLSGRANNGSKWSLHVSRSDTSSEVIIKFQPSFSLVFLVRETEAGAFNLDAMQLRNLLATLAERSPCKDEAKTGH